MGTGLAWQPQYTGEDQLGSDASKSSRVGRCCAGALVTVGGISHHKTENNASAIETNGSRFVSSQIAVNAMSKAFIVELDVESDCQMLLKVLLEKNE